MRVLVVDRHKLFAQALSSALRHDFEVLAPIVAPDEALGVVESQAPDVILVDIALADREFCAGIRDRQASASVLAVTDNNGFETDLADADYQGLVSKDTPISDLAWVIRSASSGNVVNHRRWSQGRKKRASFEEELAGIRAQHLTAREIEVLTLLVQGEATEGIAGRLSVTPNTVRTHVQNILTKLQVHSRLEAATYAVRYGLVPGSDAGPRDDREFGS